MAQEQAANSGFHGTVGSLPLVDLLQVWSMNRFSGLVTVVQESRSGQVYFVEGEVVHAEADTLTGEAAFREIVGWPDGSFKLFPNTTTLHRTIEKRIAHLLLDAHRVIDEGKRDPSAPRSPAPAAREGGKGNVFDQIRGIPGVTQVVRFGADGRPAGAGGPDAERLAAVGLYLAMTHAGAVASAFGLRDLSMATLHSEREQFVLVHSAGTYLCVGVEPDAAADQVAAQVRALLTRPAGR
ncbi:MAG TPA: DUF4388 domain-containing protein [Anaeromyxobacteraceae bacterium]|nr:DUF4388 domain-containing protein [Anaeromyxobacteraceae bacterium]